MIAKVIWALFGNNIYFANPQNEPGGKGTSEMCQSFLNSFFIGMHSQNFCMHIIRQLVYDAPSPKKLGWPLAMECNLVVITDWMGDEHGTVLTYGLI